VEDWASTSDDHRTHLQFPVNTAKTHSPLFVKLYTSILCNKPTKDLRTRAAISKKRKIVRKRPKKRLVFDELDNIYRAKPYVPKMLAPSSAGQGGTEWSENLNQKLICKDCREDPPNLVEEFSSGDMVCGSCGLVLGDRIVDTRSEWRTFSNDDQGNDDPSRVGDGANPLLNGSQLTTTIAFGDGSARSRDLLRAQGKSSSDKATKGLLAAYKEIGAHCDAVNIPKNVSDTAKHLFKLVDDAKAFKGKSQEAIIAGCIFIACRQCGVPRTFREIYALTKVSKKDIGRTFKALEKFFAQDSAGKVAMSAAKGKLCVSAITYYLILTVYLKVSAIKTNTKLQPLQTRKTSVSATAVSSVSTSKRSSKSRKVLLRRCPPSVISPVDLPCPLQLLASTWPRTFLASRRPRKKFQELLASVMALFELRTNTCIRNVRDSLSLSGSLMARARWKIFQSAEWVIP
jgi:transcription initiation factor TFIIB